MSLHTVLCDLLECRYPVVQTAMGWVSDAGLVSATCNAGGFGFLAGATIPPERLESEILRVKALTSRPFGLNIHMFQSNAADAIELVLRHKLRAVSYGRGPDGATIARLKAGGVLCMPTVGAVKHAVRAVELGADIITIQGAEGGGHTGQVPTTILLPQVLDAVSVPVVAAGGFFDGRGLAAALAFGAAGVAMGTRFLMTSDSPVPRAVLERYLAADDPAAIRVSRAVDGLPQRLIDNAELRRIEEMGVVQRLTLGIRYGLDWSRRSGLGLAQTLAAAARMAFGDRLGFSATVMAATAPVLIQRALSEGDPDGGLLPSGQVAALIDQLPSCAELLSDMIEEAVRCIDRLSAMNETADQGRKGTA
ncbi:MAG: nitronate monooxygenase [Proteobacteria bacterium]|nr:nitronate monooxygenase [Pseudomonadota bacterium]